MQSKHCSDYLDQLKVQIYGSTPVAVFAAGAAALLPCPAPLPCCPALLPALLRTLPKLAAAAAAAALLRCF